MASDVIVISTYPPEQCGVARYASQSVERWRREGQNVRVFTWGHGQGWLHLGAQFSWLRLFLHLRSLRTARRVVLHYTPGFFEPRGSRLEALTSRLALTLLFWALKNLEVVVHEHAHYCGTSTAWPRRWLWRLEVLQWNTAAQVILHSAGSRDAFCSQFMLASDRCQVVPHGRDFRSACGVPKSVARRALGLPERGLVLVSPGFISFYKGYEDAIRVIVTRRDLQLSYYIVGAINPLTAARDQPYLKELCRQAKGESRVHIIDAYLSDEEFDQWILASDVVWLPYRSCTSSSVLARCHLLGRAGLLDSRAQGLREERVDQDHVYADEEHLATLLDTLRRELA